MLQGLFDKYLPDTFLHLKKFFKYLVPTVEISMTMSICKLLESIMDKQEVTKGHEFLFVFACIWCIGGGFAEKDGKEYRKDFSNWWKEKWKNIKFHPKGVFDYFVDIENVKLEEWNKMHTKDIEKDIDTTKAISNFTIPTGDTISAQYLMKQFI